MTLADGVCVVTHPLSEKSEPAIAGLMDVVAAAAGEAALVTVNVSDDADVRHDHEVVEVSDRGTGDAVPVAAARFLANQVRLARAVARRDEDVVLFFGAVSYLLPILVARLLGKAAIVEPRGNVPASLHRIWSERLPSPVAWLLSRPVWLLERAGFVLADAVVTLSPSMTDDLGLRRYEHKLHEHGARPVDVEAFHPATPVADRDRIVGYVGRLDEEKGVDVLVDVVEHLPDDVAVLLVGDGALRPTIEDRLADRIEDGSLEITGWIDHGEVPEQLDRMRLLLMTSRTEGVPTTALEAMACGTPVVARPVGGIPDVVADGETGVLIDSDRPREIADVVDDLVRDDDRLESMSRSARSMVEDRYGFDAVVERYEAIFAAVAR